MRCALLLSFLWIAASAGLAVANPHSGAPDATFDPVLADINGPVIAEAEKTYQQLVAANQKHLKAVEDGKRERLKPDELAQSEIAKRRLARLAKRLQMAGETAGYDFMRRYTEANQVHSRLVQASEGLPPAAAYLEKARQTIARSHEPRMRELKQIEELAERGQWEQAEARLYKTLDQLHALTMYIHGVQEYQTIFNPYGEAIGAIDRALSNQRRQVVIERLTHLRDTQAPNLNGLLQEIEAAVQAVAAQGSANIEGQMRDGPSLITHFAEKWKAVQTSAIRARAANWSLAKVKESGGSGESGSLPATGFQADPLETQYAQFAQQMGPALLRFVTADAGRAGPAEVESLYTAYLAALAPVTFHRSDPNFSAAAQAALDELAGKSPELRQRVEAYRTATDELLRWRRRAAEAAAKSRAAEYPKPARQLLQATQAKNPFGGLFSEQNPDIPRAQLFASAPEVIAWANEKLLEKPVAVAPITAVVAGKSGVSRYEDRTYCTVPLSAVPSESLAALERDLMVSQTPPLSLTAATALDSARRGDFLAAGGTIRAYHLESVLTRWATLPQSAWVLSPLGELPKEANNTELTPHVLVRFDVTPQWVRHEYFFATLPATE